MRFLHREQRTELRHTRRGSSRLCWREVLRHRGRPWEARRFHRGPLCTGSGTRRGGVREDEHMCNVLGYLCPKLRHEWIEGPEGVFLEERVWF